MIKKIFILFLLNCISILAICQNLIRFYANEKVGYKNASDQIIISAKYQAGSEFLDGVAIVIENEKRGLINAQGQTVLPFVFQDLNYPTNNLIIAKQNGFYGIISMQNKWLLEPIFDVAYTFANGFARVKLKGKWGFISIHYIALPTTMYEAIGNYNLQLAPICRNGKWGYIDETGKIKIAIQYDFANSFTNNGHAVVIKKNKQYLINTKGIVVKEIQEENEEKEQYLLNMKKNKRK
jgi:WG containing repeat